MTLKIYDLYGNERDRAWLEAEHGNVQISDPAPPPTEGCYQIVELREQEGPAQIFVYVKNADGTYAAGTPVAFYWPDAPRDPEAGWLKRCVVGLVKPYPPDGFTDFAMGPGAFYAPPCQGPHAVWIYGPGRSQMIIGLGMIAGTNHRHLNVVFQWAGPPLPPSTPDPVRAARELCLALGHLQQALEALCWTCDGP